MLDLVRVRFGVKVMVGLVDKVRIRFTGQSGTGSEKP